MYVYLFYFHVAHTTYVYPFLLSGLAFVLLELLMHSSGLFKDGII